ncbi:MAG TPA: NADH-quinone oxidoreductase subunit NuoN [Actinomycetaceae bacterium]|nr:NADH-quinone oxidoreductase subunit NuoN [Actinomycetaceae bacterium]
MSFAAPNIEWAALVPVLIIFGAAVLGVLFEALVPRRPRRTAQVILALVAMAAALVAVVWRWTLVVENGPIPVVYQETIQPGFMGHLAQIVEDGPALAAQAILLTAAFLAMLVIADRTSTGEDAFAPSGATAPGSAEEDRANKAGFEQTEVFPLVMFALLGMMVFTNANDFVSLFVALEVLSLPLYVLSGLARRRRLLSQEASLKYFLLGALSSGFFLFGIALLYGFSGSFNFAVIADSVAVVPGMDFMLLAGAMLVTVGLLFKVAAVPFHSWAPDVYQGAPTPITGFMAAATKIAAFAAMLRVFYVVIPNLRWDFEVVMWVISGLTMLVGTVLVLNQQNLKRMLAYSSIAHAGFILLGVMALQPDGPEGVLFYLLAYGMATIGAFAVINSVRERDALGRITSEAGELEQWKGLGRTNPVIAGAMMVFLLSFAGIPLTAGFIGKFEVFGSALRGGLGPLVVLAILCSAATAYIYFRVMVLMFFNAPEEGAEGPEGAAVVVDSEGLSVVAIGIAAFVTILLGVIPGPAIEILGSAMAFLP